jgi:hypothetical protein
MIKSVAMAIRGPVVGWGKLERKTTVVWAKVSVVLMVE